MILASRTSAGRQLASALARYLPADPVIVALTPGGFRVAFEIASDLRCPLDAAAAVRLDVPGRPHSNFGAVGDGEVLLDQTAIDRLALPAAYVEASVERHAKLIAERLQAFRGANPPISLTGRSVVLVDDGLAELPILTVVARALRSAGAVSVILATPICTTADSDSLRVLSDYLVLLSGPCEHRGLFVCDEHFLQTVDSDIPQLIERSRMCVRPLARSPFRLGARASKIPSAVTSGTPR